MILYYRILATIMRSSQDMHEKVADYKIEINKYLQACNRVLFTRDYHLGVQQRNHSFPKRTATVEAGCDSQAGMLSQCTMLVQIIKRLY